MDMEQEQVFIQKLISSALHEIWKTLYNDTSNLVIHQLVATECYNDEEGIEHENTPEEEKQLKADCKAVVLKYHIYNENGVAAKCTPIIDYVVNGHQLTAEQLQDQFVQNVLNKMQHFTSINQVDLLKQIMDIDNPEELSEESIAQRVINSYPQIDEQDIVIWEDGDVQCGCSYCDKFFEMNDIDIENIPFETLNFIQRILAQNYSDIMNDPNVDDT